MENLPDTSSRDRGTAGRPAVRRSFDFRRSGSQRLLLRRAGRRPVRGGRVFLGANGDLAVALAGGGSTPRRFGRAVPRTAALGTLSAIDWVPDLGSRIGSATWWRGAITCAALCWTGWSLTLPLAVPVAGSS